MDDIYFADPSNTTYETIIANGKGLMRDFGLKVKSIEIGMPDIWQHLVEVPGRNGPIDMTDFAGRPAFKSRQILVSLDKEESYTDWLTKYTELVNFLYGNRFNILIMPDDKHYFTGRCLFNMTKDNDVITDHEFEITCDPMRTIIPAFSDAYNNVSTGITSTGNYQTEIYAGAYSHDFKISYQVPHGAMDFEIHFKQGEKVIKYSYSDDLIRNPFELSTLPFTGKVTLELINIAMFSLSLVNKEL